MRYTDESQTQKTAPSDASAQEKRSTRWIEEPAPQSIKQENPAGKKTKKKPFIQIPVIISMCLVIVSLLGYFTFKMFIIQEPENVVWKWTSDDDEDWYIEFKDDKAIIYCDSREIETNYIKEKSDGSKHKLTLPYPQPVQVGCFIFGEEMEYKITGTRVFGNQTMTLSYDFNGETVDFELKQVDKLETNSETLPEDFIEDKSLTGEWIEYYNEGSSIVFNDDGSCYIATVFDFGGDYYVKDTFFYTYTLDESTMILRTDNGTELTSVTYAVKDGVLYMNGKPVYYRKDYTPATPDEA